MLTVLLSRPLSTPQPRAWRDFMLGEEFGEQAGSVSEHPTELLITPPSMDY
jgi:hypothetical protein